MFCKECGEIIADDSKFCSMCGVAQEESSTSTKTEKGNTTVKIIKDCIKDAAAVVGTDILQESLEHAGKSVMKKAKKTAKKTTHKVLVKAGVEKKNFFDVFDDLKKKKK